MGGYDSARVVHFAGMTILVGFVLVQYVGFKCADDYYQSIDMRRRCTLKHCSR